MTVSSSISKVVHKSNSNCRVYAVPFKTLTAHEIGVCVADPVSGRRVFLTPDWDYTVSGLNQDACCVTLTERGAEKAGHNLDVAIFRSMDFTQPTRYLAYDVFPAKSHETAMDRLTMQNQQLLEMIGRAVLAPPESDQPLSFSDMAELKAAAAEQAERAEKAGAAAMMAAEQAARTVEAVEAVAAALERLQPSRRRLTANTTYYANPDTGNDRNDGLSADGAVKTIDRLRELMGATDCGPFSLTVSLAPGHYTQPLNLNMSVLSQSTILVTCTVPGGRVALPSIRVDGLNVDFDNIFLDIKANGNIPISSDSFIRLRFGPIWGNCTIKVSGSSNNSAIWAAQATISLAAGNRIIFDNFSCSVGTFCLSSGATVTLAPKAVLEGTVTGRRYYIVNGAIFNSNGQGPNAIPGTLAGYIQPGSGGLYV